jgi:predicted transcriptional regulator
MSELGRILEELQELRRRVERLEALFEERVLGVEEASPDDIAAVEAARREYREGRTVSHEEVLRRFLQKDTG